MSNFYSNLEPRSFWRRAVSEKTIFNLHDFYRRKFDISRDDRIATAGSCFAQHVAANMRKRGFNILDVEPAPDFLSPAEARDLGYGIYSARYGNIYTVRQMLQLLADANSGIIRDEDFIAKNGRYIDALRPNTEPDGYESLEEARFARQDHLEKVKELFSGAELVVFTLGLTEAWEHKTSGTVYPLLPDTLTDEDTGNYKFHNFTYPEIASELRAVRQMLQTMSPGVRMLLTVSPVPLTATASSNHVMVATTYSKSVLRAVCGEMEAEFADVDYFPSYEVITAPLSHGVFYEPNMRSVNSTGVNTAMSLFFAEHDREPAAAAKATTAKPAAAGEPADEDEVVCEEIMLEAFSR